MEVVYHMLSSSTILPYKNCFIYDTSMDPYHSKESNHIIVNFKSQYQLIKNNGLMKRYVYDFL